MDKHSRLVSFLKVLLPLVALALLSTLFLLSRSDDPDATIPISEAEIADRLRDQQMTAPFFSGTTSRGDEILIAAANAKPGDTDSPATIAEMTGRITLPGAAQVTLRARTGTFQPDQNTVTFNGDVAIHTTTGFDLTTRTLVTALDEIDIYTVSGVSGTGPFGELTAGRMELSAKTGDGDAHLLFKNQVKLVYDPKLVER